MKCSVSGNFLTMNFLTMRLGDSNRNFRSGPVHKNAENHGGNIAINFAFLKKNKASRFQFGERNNKVSGSITPIEIPWKHWHKSSMKCRYNLNMPYRVYKLSIYTACTEGVRAHL